MHQNIPIIHTLRNLITIPRIVRKHLKLYLLLNISLVFSKVHHIHYITRSSSKLYVPPLAFSGGGRNSQTHTPTQTSNGIDPVWSLLYYICFDTGMSISNIPKMRYISTKSHPAAAAGFAVLARCGEVKHKLPHKQRSARTSITSNVSQRAYIIAARRAVPKRP